MPKVLIVEPSKSLAQLLKFSISESSRFESITVSSLEDAESMLSTESKFSLLITGASAFASSAKKMIEKVEDWAIPTLLYTSIKNQEFQSLISDSVIIIDYIIKDSPNSLDYLVGLVKRFEQNAGIHALVVDDSRSQREYLNVLMKNYNFKVSCAGNGIEALSILDATTPDIKLVITDYNMPKMDGPALIRAIRSRSRLKQAVIIGVTSTEKGSVAVEFIKNGADDYVKKPFYKEEFFSRVNKSLELSEKSIELKAQALNDFLTGVANRRSFFLSAPMKLASLKKQNKLFSVIQIDLDHFKKINDKHGHEAGDEVLKATASVLNSLFHEDEIFARLGGEEFGALLKVESAENLLKRLEDLRVSIESLEIIYNDKPIPVTASIGAMYCSEISSLASIDEYIEIADKALYASKHNGRNMFTVF